MKLIHFVMKSFPLFFPYFALHCAPSENPLHNSTASGNSEISKHSFTIDDLLSVQRLGDPQLSPDGKWVAYTIKTCDLKENKLISHIWIVSSAPGGKPQQLTSGKEGESRPRWSPDGKWIAFTATLDEISQIWVIPAAGGKAQQISHLSTGADGHIWSPKGNLLAFASDVYPDCIDDDANKRKIEEIKASKVEAKTIDRLLYRHWTTWRDGKCSHLFTIPFDSAKPKLEKATDLTPGIYDVPPFSLDSPDAYAFSPDGSEIVYTQGADPSIEAWSTHADLVITSVDGKNRRTITTEANKGWNGSPVYSPDGRFIAYCSQKRDGYESDVFRLFVYDRKTHSNEELFPKYNPSVQQLFWTGGNQSTLYAITLNPGKATIRIENTGGVYPFQQALLIPAFPEKKFSDLSISADGKIIVALCQSFQQAPELCRLDYQATSEWKLTPLTHTNDMLFASLEMPSYESIEYQGALASQIQAWLIKPPSFDKTKKYPFLLWIHGGPQGSWTDAFSYRWNPMLFAAQGYIVLLPNPHGSTGFGQQFTEQISGDWSGACYEDLMKGVDWAIAQGFVDPERMGAAGGSFGGYMVNWILGHTNRFKALMSHAGVYNLVSMYGVTEELWFPEWELKGTPWNDPAGDYAKFSPHQFAAKFKTPTLVIHGELDFRVPIGEGLQLFTALKRQGVPSRLLYFPDEGHWILKPKNGKLWNETVLDWFDRYLKVNKQ